MSESTSDNTQVDIADDPSMEDILASIRKIIAEDDVADDMPEMSASAGQDIKEDFSGLDALLKETEADAEEQSTDPFVNDLTDIEISEVETEKVENELDSLMSELELVDDEVDSEAFMSSSVEDVELSNLAEELLSDDLTEKGPDLSQDTFEADAINTSIASSSSELVDLDIEALLGEVEAASDTDLESIDNLLIDTESLEASIEAIEIPEMESETVQGALNAPTDLSDDDVLFNELETLLDNTTSDITPEVQASQNEARLLNPEAILAESSTDSETHTDLGILLDEDDEDLNALLEGLATEEEPEKASLEDLVSVSDRQTEQETEQALDEVALEIDAQSPEMSRETIEPQLSDSDIDISDMSLEDHIEDNGNEDPDIALVKSLMAELSDPDINEADVASPYSTVDDNTDMSLEGLFETDVDIEVETEAKDLAVANLAEESLTEEDVVEAEKTSENVGQCDASDSELIPDLELEPEDLLESAEDSTENILEDILFVSDETHSSDDIDDLEAALEIPEQEAEMPPWDEEGENKSTEIVANVAQPSLESVIADEAENLALNEADSSLSETIEDFDLEDQEPLETFETEPRSSLMDIADAAEKDASDIEASLDNKTQNETIPALPNNKASYIGTTGFGALVLGASAIGARSLSVSGKDLKSTSLDDDTLLPQSNLQSTATDEDVVTNTDLKDTDTLSEEPLETQDMPKTATNSDTILDEVSKEASASAFASLNKVVEEKAVVAERGDRIGDLVMEALRPMLKEWLDDNLQDIVERAVAKEVKRIASGD